jgi:hypothetical protein
VSTDSQRLDEGRQRPGEVVAGFLSALAIFVAAIGIAWHPLRLIPISMLISVVGAGMAPRGSKLGLAGCAIAALAFFLGMTIAVITSRPLW